MGRASSDRADYVQAVAAELALAHRTVTAECGEQVVQTIFLGGGTPTLLSDEQLGGILTQIRDRWQVADEAEISLEANPDTVTPQRARAWAAAGVTRVSLGMQSAESSVLKVLERTHSPQLLAAAVDAVKAAGLSVSVDVIYGTPGESVQSWQNTLAAVVALQPDHVSAYALTIEPGTAMGRRLRQGHISGVDDDDQATKYELADEVLTAAGFSWYEISNWARTAADRSRHNYHYWTGGLWWGIGPGAHSYLPGRRWWNIKHPGAYATALRDGTDLVAGAEELSPADQRLEQVMLRIRTCDGIRVADLVPAGQETVPRLVAEGLLVEQADRLVLTVRGRLLADTVTHQLLGH